MIELTQPVAIKGAKKQRIGRAMARMTVNGEQLYDVVFVEKDGTRKVEVHNEKLLDPIGEPWPNIIPNQPDAIEEAEVEKALPAWMAWFRRSRARA